VAPVATAFILPSLIAGRAFAHVCSIIQIQHENCRIIPVDSTFAAPVRHR